MLLLLPQRVVAQETKAASIEAVFERLRVGHKTFDELTQQQTCTVVMSMPKPLPAPSLTGEPLWIRSIGIEVGFVRPTPYTGHEARVRFQPIQPVAPNTHIRFHLVGPDFERTEIIEMPEGEPAPVELIIPKINSEGIYLMVLESLIEDTADQTWSQQYRHFDVYKHPLSNHVLLPRGFTETHRFVESRTVDDAQENPPPPEALVTCGKQNEQQVCVRTTDSLAHCSAHLDTPVSTAPKRHGSAKHPVARWCSDDRMLTLYSSRKKNQQDAIEDLQWLFPSDAPE